MLKKVMMSKKKITIKLLGNIAMDSGHFIPGVIFYTF